jgi:hypothetical protein
VAAVESRPLTEVLRAAAAGDPDSVEAILARYMPLLDKLSAAGGALDEDMRQYIIMRVIMEMPKFRP